MLRKKIRQVISEETSRERLSKLLRLLTLIGFVWILSFPYMANEVFTSENAFNGEFLKSAWRHDKAIYPVFKDYK